MPDKYKTSEDLELRKQEEALLSLSVKALHRSVMTCKATTGVRVDDFHPRVSLDLSDECCGRVHTLLHEIQMTAWPTNASTTLFSPIPNSTTSEQAIAALLTLIR